ncbi:MAG: MarR family transcriptional regulator [Nanoarchaeota archaeon]|nr:MarR family transcriptional regulator [Nanoarchaeota archaeon]
MVLRYNFMQNKNVGFLILGMSLIIITIVLIFNLGLKKIVTQTCTHGSECSMYGTISIQTGISLAIAWLVFIIGLFLIFSKSEEKIVIKTIKDKKKKIDLTNLDKDEKKIMKLILEERGGMFQADLMEKLEIGKVKTTRLLDKLEAKQLIERKRRGMNNIVILKN